jgi:ATP adenylyltransferase
MNDLSECLFCRILESPEEERKWHDQVLFERHGISVLPGLGPQREGYLLIVPHVHAFSCAELSEGTLHDLEEVKEEVAHVLNQAYGPCIFFEHGACGHSRRAGGCIDHVHVHALPLEAPIVDIASRDRTFTRLRDGQQLREWVQKPYLAIQDQAGNLFVADGEGIPGQFIRRKIGEAIESPNDWDFEVFPHKDRMRAGIDRLAALFKGIEETDPRYAQQWEKTGPRSPLVYLARAVDNRPPPDVVDVGQNMRAKLRDAGFAAVDPVASTFPRTQIPLQENNEINDFGRVRSDLAWLRRSDAVLIDMHIEDWSYVGCICELVYAYLWGIPTVVVVGSSLIRERLWLKYHATTIVEGTDEAIAELQKLFASNVDGDDQAAPSIAL